MTVPVVKTDEALQEILKLIEDVRDFDASMTATRQTLQETSRAINTMLDSHEVGDLNDFRALVRKSSSLEGDFHEFERKRDLARHQATTKAEQLLRRHALQIGLPEAISIHAAWSYASNGGCVNPGPPTPEISPKRGTKRKIPEPRLASTGVGRGGTPNPPQGLGRPARQWGHGVVARKGP